MRFGEFEFDENLWELKRGGERLQVQRKALEVLAYLCRRGGNVVGVAELQRAIWGQTTVTDGSLRQAMLQLRRALGTDAAQIIVNVRGLGYRIGVPIVPRSAAPAGKEASRSEFVGRQGEMASIEASLASVRASGARLALVTGEPGIGKTRLAQEVVRSSRSRGFHVAFARCSDEAGAPEFWPWIQVFRGPSSLPLLGDDAAFGRTTELEALFESSENHPGLTPAQAQFRLFDAVRTRLHAVSEKTPVALVFDDLHWADDSSLRLLRFVARSLRDTRLFVLGTYRDAQVDLRATAAEILGAVACIEGARTYPLRGLAREDVGRLLADALPDLHREREAARLCDWTGGNPLFLVHLLPLLEDAEKRSDDALPLARGVRAAVAMLVARIRPELRGLISMAAVAGVEFRVSVLSLAMGLTPPAVLELLDEARAAGLLHRESDEVFRFVHALLRDVLYAEAEPSQRAARHHALARALESRGAPPSELAHHFGLSGASERTAAAKYARIAGRLARARLAYDESVSRFADALEWLRQAGAATEDVLEVLLDLGSAQSALGRIVDARATFHEAAILARNSRSARRLAEVALNLAPGFFGVQTGVHDAYLEELLREALAVLGEGDEDVALRARLMGRLAWALYFTPHRAERELLGARAVALARASGDLATLAYALVARHASAWSPDNLEERFAFLHEALALARSAEDVDTACVARCFLIVDHIEAGDVLSLDRELQSLREAGRTHGGAHLYSLAYVGMRALMEGRFDDVERVALEYLAIGERIDDHNARQAFGVHLAFTRIEQGRAAEVFESVAAYAQKYPSVPGWRALTAFVAACSGDLDTARRDLGICGADGFTKLPRDYVWLTAVTFCANTAAVLKDERAAEALYELLGPYAERYVPVGHGVSSLGSVERYLGMLAAVLSKSLLDAWHRRACAHLTKAIDRNECGGLRTHAAWARAELGLLLSLEENEASAGKARELLASARETAAALGMGLLLQHIEAGGLQRSGPHTAANRQG